MTVDPLRLMVRRYQCPGCARGNGPEDGCYQPDAVGCTAHRPGTFVSGQGEIALGLPKGFNRLGPGSCRVRLVPDAATLRYNRLNVPVWAMVHEGDLFVRTVMPRMGLLTVDVVKDGTLALVPAALDVATFIEEID